jgi:hypothetical protein
MGLDQESHRLLMMLSGSTYDSCWVWYAGERGRSIGCGAEFAETAEGVGGGGGRIEISFGRPNVGGAKGEYKVAVQGLIYLGMPMT